MAQGICDGLTVIEGGDGNVAGSMIGMMLADNGAHVVKLESPDGDALRTTNPNGFLVWNRGKDSVVCDLDTPDGQARARELVAKADVFIDGFGTGVTDDWGLGYDALHATNPALVYCAIRGFASTGPYAHLPADEAIIAAKSGWYFRPGNFSRPGPQFMNELVGSYGAAAMGLGSLMAALGVRHETGRGQRMEASLYQGFSPLDYFGVTTLQAEELAARDASAVPPRAPAGGRMGFLTVTKDGRWFQFCGTMPRQFEGTCRVLGLDRLMAAELRFANAPYFSSVADADEFEDHVWAATRNLTAAELQARVLAEPDCAGEFALATVEAMDHEQIIHNGHVIELDDARLGTVKEIGPIGRFSATPSRITRSAPALGEAQREPSGPNVPAGGGPTPAHPLAGITIIEFGYFYAMPNGVAMAAALGARVIKIEDQRGDPQRWSFGIRESGGCKAMMGKESLAINLRLPEGQAVIHRMVEDADVFVCGFRAGVAERMHLGYDDLKAINPRLVYLHATGYGYDGPQGRRPCYAQAATAVAGGYYRQSGEWLDPAKADGLSMEQLRTELAPHIEHVVTGDAYASLGVFASLSLAIYHQRHTGEGQFVSTTMMNGTLYGDSDDFVSYDGRPPLPFMDDEHWGLSALYRCYPAAEGFVVLAAPTDKAWRSLVSALGRPELADDARFIDAAARKANDSELVGVLAEVFRSKVASDWEGQLVAQGIACVQVNEMTPSQFTVTDHGLRQSGLTFEVDDPTFGPNVREGAPGQFSETPARIAPPPVAGQHTDALLAEFSYWPEAITELKAAAVVFDNDACRMN